MDLLDMRCLHLIGIPVVVASLANLLLLPEVVRPRQCWASKHNPSGQAGSSSWYGRSLVGPQWGCGASKTAELRKGWNCQNPSSMGRQLPALTSPWASLAAPPTCIPLTGTFWTTSASAPSADHCNHRPARTDLGLLLPLFFSICHPGPVLEEWWVGVWSQRNSC